jgi:hypothetical protein
MSAASVLREAAAVIEQRAQFRDTPDGERSMERAVKAFNTLTGANLTELEGWIFMSVLKLARATAGKPHLDDYTDLAGYAALAAECVQRDGEDRGTGFQVTKVGPGIVG